MIPILWLTGPPGVGKTAVAWDIYQRLQSSGAVPAYVDVDQLGICFPPPADDPHRHALKARNVAGLRANFEAAGARALIVSGVVDAQRGPDVEAVGGRPVASVRLRAEPEELMARLRRRDGSSPQHAAALKEAEALDRSTFATCCVDTSGLTVAEAAASALAAIRDWPWAGSRSSDAPPARAGAPEASNAEILVVTGAPSVGKSTIGFRAYLDLLGSGGRVAYVDIAQIGFCSAAPGEHGLRARNFAALWSNFHAVGARQAIVTGRVLTRAEARLYEQALVGATLSWRRLRVGEAELTRRIFSRGGGGSWAEPGDPPSGRSEGELRRIADQAQVSAGRLDRDNVGQPIDVDGLDVAAAAAALLAGWPEG